MADMTLLQAISLLEGLPGKVAKEGAEVMREEFNHKHRKYATGETSKSIHGEVLSSELVFIGASTPGAYWVQKGRGAVRPIHATWLRWKDGPPNSNAKYIYAKYSRPVAPDDYIGRTAKRLQSMNFL